VAYVVAFLIFAVLSAASWFISVACYRSTYKDGPDPAASPSYRSTALCTIGAVTLASFIPFPAGYVAGLVAGASVLVGYLALASVVTRLLVLGVLDVI